MHISAFTYIHAHQVHELGSGAFRVLAFACKTLAFEDVRTASFDEEQQPYDDDAVADDDADDKDEEDTVGKTSR
jgi:hypothetical protein